MQHMDEGLLQAWLDGPGAGLTEGERASVEAHLDQCPVCRGRVETLRVSSDRVAELLAAAADADHEIPDFAAVVRRADELNGDPEEGVPAPTRGKPEGNEGPHDGPRPDVGAGPRPWWGRRTAWAASILVALGAGWLANEWNTTMPELRLDPLQVTEPRTSVESGAFEGSAGPAQANRTQVEAEESAAEDRPSALADASAVPVEAPSASAGAGAPAPDRRISESPQARAAGEQASRLAPPPAEPDPVVQIDATPVEPRPTALDELAVTEAAEEEDVLEADRFAATVPTALSDERWRPASTAQARSHLGAPVGTVPGLPVATVHIGTFDELPVVRVAQELGDGSLLTLLQGRTPVVPGDVAVATAVAELPGGVFVRGWADLPADSLRALMDEVRAN